jgi:hypothetical protein
MQDIIENAKRAANTAIERAAWEADKLRRVSARQREMELAQRERATLLEQLAQLAMDLESRGQLSPASLVALVQRLRTLEREVGQGQADMQAIRSETFTPGSVAITVTRRDAGASRAGAGASPAAEVSCPRCGQRSRASATFCASCGARLR